MLPWLTSHDVRKTGCATMRHDIAKYVASIDAQPDYIIIQEHINDETLELHNTYIPPRYTSYENRMQLTKVMESSPRATFSGDLNWCGNESMMASIGKIEEPPPHKLNMLEGTNSKRGRSQNQRDCDTWNALLRNLRPMESRHGERGAESYLPAGGDNYKDRLDARRGDEGLRVRQELSDAPGISTDHVRITGIVSLFRGGGRGESIDEVEGVRCGLLEARGLEVDGDASRIPCPRALAAMGRTRESLSRVELGIARDRNGGPRVNLGGRAVRIRRRFVRTCARRMLWGGTRRPGQGRCCAGQVLVNHAGLVDACFHPQCPCLVSPLCRSLCSSLGMPGVAHDGRDPQYSGRSARPHDPDNEECVSPALKRACHTPNSEFIDFDDPYVCVICEGLGEARVPCCSLLFLAVFLAVSALRARCRLLRPGRGSP